MIYVGIDPGTPVTIVALGNSIMDCWDGAQVATFEKRAGSKTPKPVNNADLIRAALAPYAALQTLVVIERVSAMPGQGLSSSTRFVGSMYLCQGIAVGLGMRVKLVTPAAWKRKMGLTSDKERSRAEALRLWPECAHLFKRKGDHDRAEAALLAQWGRENLR